MPTSLARAPPGRRKPARPDPVAAFVPYLTARLQEDPHVWTTARYDEAVALGFPRSDPAFTRALRRRTLRPPREACRGVKGRPTIAIAHPPGEELQWDWLERLAAPWGGEAHLLVGTLSHSGQCRAVLAEAEDQAQLSAALDAVLRRLGGTALRWRFVHLPGVVEVGTDRLLASFAAVATYYGVAVAVCAPRRANRKGAVEKSNDFLTGRWWRTMSATTLLAAQAALGHFVERIGDQRRRQQQSIAELAAAEPLLALPAQPYPATLTVDRVVSATCLVAFRGNQSAVLPGLEGGTVQVRWRLGTTTIDLVAPSGARLTTRTLAPPGAGRILHSDAQRAALEAAIFASLTTTSPSPARRIGPLVRWRGRWQLARGCSTRRRPTWPPVVIARRSPGAGI